MSAAQPTAFVGGVRFVATHGSAFGSARGSWLQEAVTQKLAIAWGIQLVVAGPVRTRFVPAPRNPGPREQATASLLVAQVREGIGDNLGLGHAAALEQLLGHIAVWEAVRQAVAAHVRV